MTWSFKHEIFPLAIIVLSLGLGAYFNAVLPPVVPSHFDSRGMPNGHLAKGPFILTMIGIIVVLYLLMTFLPRIDPFWTQMRKRYDVFLVFRDAMLAFFLLLQVATLLSARSGRLDPRIIGVGLGLLMVLLGNYLPRIPRNFFFGIRSPWTLASETVWRKTHVFSGWLFVLGGILVILLTLSGVRPEIALMAILIPLVVVTAFAYPIYQFKKLPPGEQVLGNRDKGSG